MQLGDLEKYTGQLLQCDRFRDYAPNGVQVTGRDEVKRLLCGVTASVALIDAAIAWQADAIVVHHGYFWRGEDARIIGAKQQRLSRLIKHDISLLAYHLPLDAHPELGNNAQLGARFGLQATGRFGEQDMCWSGALAQPMTLGDFGAQIGAALGRAPTVIGEAAKPIQRVGWCTGGAQGYFADAIAQGVDVYVTGEASERNYHEAVESGVAFIAAGHHATERYGVQALTQHLAQQFALEWCYVDLDNPL